MAPAPAAVLARRVVLWILVVDSLAAAWSARDNEPPVSLRQVQRAALAGGSSYAIVKRVARGRPPALRSVLGAREEAALVDEAAPGGGALVLRAISLLLRFLPVLLTAPLAVALGPFRRRVWFWLVTRALASAGTAFIKWGQWAAIRPDMFPERLCAELGELHSSAPVHSASHTRREVEAALGAPLERVFDSFDAKPLASGSIAQVHRATLAGREVAVKVRHPHVVHRIITDFTLMRLAAEASARLPMLAYLNLKASVGQFSETMVAQTRLDIEGEHLDRFNWNFGTASWHDVDFPRTVRPRGVAPTKSVLVESFEPGELVSRYTVARPDGRHDALPPPLAHFIVSRGEDVYLKMLLVDNLMHADMHPGNILLDARAGRQRRAGPRIVMLDVGMVARLTRAESRAFIALLHAMGAGDGAAAARAVLRFAARQEVCVGRERVRAFTADMRDLFAARCRGYGTGVEFGSVLRGVLGHVRTHRVTVEANYMTLVMNVLCLESMAKELLPAYNVLDAARPVLATQRRLPPFAFRATLPLLRSVKGLRDAIWLLGQARAKERRERRERRRRERAERAAPNAALVQAAV